MNSFVLNLKEGKPYNLILDVEQAFPGSEAGISSTLTSLTLFQLRKIELCDLSSQKSQLNESESKQHLTSNSYKALTPLEATQCLFL